MHVLRKIGKRLKPGSSKLKPKSVFDVELVSGEPIDFEELEVQWMEDQIRKKKEEPQQLTGKRLRDAAVNALKKLGVSDIEFNNLPCGKLDQIPLLEINKIIEKGIDEFKPTMIFTHSASDLNQDHKIININGNILIIQML